MGWGEVGRHSSCVRNDAGPLCGEYSRDQAGKARFQLLHKSESGSVWKGPFPISAGRIDLYRAFFFERFESPFSELSSMVVGPVRRYEFLYILYADPTLT